MLESYNYSLGVYQIWNSTFSYKKASDFFSFSRSYLTQSQNCYSKLSDRNQLCFTKRCEFSRLFQITLHTTHFEEIVEHTFFVFLPAFPPFQIKRASANQCFLFRFISIISWLSFLLAALIQVYLPYDRCHLRSRF